ncbi:MAG: hypothetical protein ABSH14_01600 [Verrucomicrobiia bacterium]|jgi:hypothetical protein
MPSFETHCEETRRVLGGDFADVHKWMDELFAKVGPRHRRHRHHRAGIGFVRGKWGEKAAEAARLHIAADLKEEGWVEGRDRLPRDEQDFVRMGLL